MAKNNKSAQDRQKGAAHPPVSEATQSAALPANHGVEPARKTKFATAAEAADFLHLCKASIHNGINKGHIPSRRYGSAVRIPWEWLEEQLRIVRVA